MKNIKIEMLTEMTPSQVEDQFPNVDVDIFKESGVYSLDIGSRGELDDYDMVASSDLTDEFSVKTVEEIEEIVLSSTLIDMEDEEELEFATQFVSSDFESLEHFQVYMECYYEESHTVYVRVAV